MTSEVNNDPITSEQEPTRGWRRVRLPRLGPLRRPVPRPSTSPTGEDRNPAPPPPTPRPRPPRQRGRHPTWARSGRPRPWLTPARLLTLIAVVVGAYAAIAVVNALRTVLIMLLVAVFLSFAMEPAVQWLARRGWRRGLATGAVFLALFLMLAALIAALATLLVDQVRGLITSVPGLLDNLAERFDLPLFQEVGESRALSEQISDLQGDLGSRLQEVLLGAAGNVVSIGTTAFGMLFQVATIALVTFYLVADGPRVRQALARPLPPDRQREMLAIWEIAVARTGGYVYSRILLAAIATVATTVFLLVIGVPYPLPLGLVVGTTSVFIPVIGTYLGGVLVLLVAFVNQSSRGDVPTDAIWTLVFLVVYQQIENYLLAPRVQARTMDVHPAVAFVSVVIGGTLLGAVGALLALPATAILQALLSTYVRRHQLIDEFAGIDLPTDPRAASRTQPQPGVGRAGTRAEA